MARKWSPLGLSLLVLSLAACEQQYGIQALTPDESQSSDTTGNVPAGSEPTVPSGNPDLSPSGNAPGLNLPEDSASDPPTPPAPPKPDSGYVIPDATPGVNAGCMPVKATVLGFSGADITATGGAVITGDMILFPYSRLTLSGSSIITGSVFYDADSCILSADTSLAGKLRAVNPSTQQEIVNYVTALAGLPATRTFDKIDSTQRIVGNGKLNVIRVNGSLNLESSEALILEGDASDVFVINVSGGISITARASIQPSGGVLPKNIVLNAVGGGTEITLAGSGLIAGTFVGIERGASVGGTGVLQGSLYSGKTVKIAGGGQVWEPVIFCSSSN